MLFDDTSSVPKHKHKSQQQKQQKAIVYEHQIIYDKVTSSTNNRKDSTP